MMKEIFTNDSYDSYKTIDIAEVERYLGSMEFTIPTKSILDLQSKVIEWISMNDCGAIIYGESRVGKTRAIRYLASHLKEKYGSQLPVYTMNATDQIPTQKNFYATVLGALGHEEAYKGTAVQMRQRIVNRIIVNALDTKYRRAVLFVDEAYLLSIKEYTWLIDLYNELNLKNILLTVFLVGTPELKEQKSGFIRAGKKQIVLRFMVNEFEFKGITSLRDAMICMASIDKPFKIPGYNSDIILSKLFFPKAYESGYEMVNFAEDLWNAFKIVKQQNDIHDDQIVMKHFMAAITYCFRKYGAYNEAVFAPTTDEWINSIVDSGFVSSQI